MTPVPDTDGVRAGLAGRAGVAFVCHPYHRGGVTRWMVDAAAEFRRRGTTVWFIAPEPRRPFPSGGRRPTMSSLLHALPATDRPTIISPRVGVEFELGTVAYRASVYSRAITQQVPSGIPCIVSDDPSVWKGAASVSGLYPIVGVLHGDDKAYYALAERFRSELARCVAVSRRIAEGARRNAGVEDITVIPCGIPVAAMPDVVPGEAARLIWVGRMEEEFKRVSDLPKVAVALRARGIDFELDIVGDGAGGELLRQAVSEHGLESRVHYHGWRTSEETWRLLSGSDVMLLPSNKEGMPIVMMEALAAGCAVVASRISGVEDIVEDPLADGVVLAHAVGDVDGAAALVAAALRRPTKERRAAARALAEARFSIGVCVDRYETLVADALPCMRSKKDSVDLTILAAASLPLSMARAARRKAREWTDR